MCRSACYLQVSGHRTSLQRVVPSSLQMCFPKWQAEGHRAILLLACGGQGVEGVLPKHLDVLLTRVLPAAEVAGGPWLLEVSFREVWSDM